MQENRSWIVSWGPWIGAILVYFVISQAVGYMTDTQAELRREARDRQTAEFMAGQDGDVQVVDVIPVDALDDAEETFADPDEAFIEAPEDAEGLPQADPTSLDIEAEIIESDEDAPITPLEETEDQFEVHPAPEDGGVQPGAEDEAGESDTQEDD